MRHHDAHADVGRGDDFAAEAYGDGIGTADLSVSDHTVTRMLKSADVSTWRLSGLHRTCNTPSTPASILHFQSCSSALHTCAAQLLRTARRRRPRLHGAVLAHRS